MSRLPTADFCLECLETSDYTWYGGRPFEAHCAHAPTCRPFPASIEGTRYEYLALVSTLDRDFQLQSMHEEGYTLAITTVIHNLNTEFVKAVHAHEARYRQDPTGLEVFITSHAASVSIDPQPRTAIPGKSQTPHIMYAKAMAYPRLQQGDHGWYIWRAAIRDLNKSMMKIIEKWDESDYRPGDQTCLQDWIQDFPLPLEDF